jgi:NitT/TauT family transport system ATP-binding protein
MLPSTAVTNRPTPGPQRSPQLPSPVLKMSGVTLQYRTETSIVTAVYRVSFDVHHAERFILLGASGCGKSTLLKAAAGFIKPVEGSIEVNGCRVSGPGPNRMMVFQEFDQLLPWKSVEENIAYPMLVSGRFKRKNARERARCFMAKVGLEKFRDSFPYMLSGGMKQRVSIARAMAMEPDVLLMDEPFAALDALTRRKMQEELLQLWDDVRFTVVFVTHSIEEAVIVGSRVLVLTPHPGRVRAELDADPCVFADQGSGEFAGLCNRIHSMLFTPLQPHPQGGGRG